MEFKGYTIVPDAFLDLEIDIWETIILAVIYGYSKDGRAYRGSWRYLEKKAKCSRTKVARSLRRLVELGLIEKMDVEIRGVRLCEYRASLSVTTSTSDVPGDGVRDEPNIIIDNNIDINTLSMRACELLIPSKPSKEEVRQFCLEAGLSVDADIFFDFYESNGWMVGKSSMRDWRAALRNWDRRRTPVVKERRNVGKIDSTFTRSLMKVNRMFRTVDSDEKCDEQ